MKRISFGVFVTLALSAFAIYAEEQTAFSGAGVIESTTGGFKFPDGTQQTSASTDTLAELACEADQVAKYDGANWICSSDEIGTGLDGICTAITSLPYVINTEGVYCLTGNLETSITSGNAIDVQASDVIIDLDGWKLDGFDAGTLTSANGIYAINRSNITIKNGTIRGFYRGIYFHGSPPEFSESFGHLIEGIRLVQNTLAGIIVLAKESIIQNNHILETGGSTKSPSVSALGVNAWGPSNRVLNNDITNTFASGTNPSNGIEVLDAHGSIIERNRIDIVDGYTHAVGVHIRSSTSVLVLNNRITNALRGVYFNPSDGTPTGKFGNNVTSDVTTPFEGGTDLGGND